MSTFVGRKPLSKHHRKPKTKGGNSKPRNISHVPEWQHIAFHQLFGNKQPHEIAEILTRTWIDPDYIIIARRRNA